MQLKCKKHTSWAGTDRWCPLVFMEAACAQKTKENVLFVAIAFVHHIQCMIDSFCTSGCTCTWGHCTLCLIEIEVELQWAFSSDQVIFSAKSFGSHCLIHAWMMHVSCSNVMVLGFSSFNHYTWSHTLYEDVTITACLFSSCDPL